MPGGMHGVQLTVEARHLRPELRMLLTSGYTGTVLDEQGVPADLPLLSSPRAVAILWQRGNEAL
jgi:hypothetical protein